MRRRFSPAQRAHQLIVPGTGQVHQPQREGPAARAHPRVVVGGESSPARHGRSTAPTTAATSRLPRGLSLNTPAAESPKSRTAVDGYRCAADCRGEDAVNTRDGGTAARTRRKDALAEERVRRRGRRGRRPAGDGLAANPSSKWDTSATGCVARLPGAGLWSVRRNCPRATAAVAKSCGGASSAFWPGNQGTSRPSPRGNPRAPRQPTTAPEWAKATTRTYEKHRCSCSISAAEAARRGRRCRLRRPGEKACCSHPSPSSFSADAEIGVLLQDRRLEQAVDE